MPVQANTFAHRDFNVPQIDWDVLFSAEPEGHYSHRLIQCIQDCFVTQHVSSPTRFSPGKPSSLLDLLLASEEGMVRDLSYHLGHGHSNHIAFMFNLACYTARSIPMVKTSNYNKGDYGLLKSRAVILIGLGCIIWMCSKDITSSGAVFKLLSASLFQK